MLIEDNIFTLLNEYELPLSRGSISIIEYLESYYTKYINSLQLVVQLDKKGFIRSEFYDKLSKEIHNIDAICQKIIEILKLYDLANMITLYDQLDKLLIDLNKHFSYKIFDINQPIMPRLYRIRTSNDDSVYTREQIFHIPLNKREYIKSYRYSIAGYPCLYLSSSIELCWFECGMPKNFNVSEFQFSPQNSKVLKLVDFTIRPKDIIETVTSYYPKQKELAEKFLLDYFLLFPLMAACSVQAKDRDTSYIQEYIFPQLLLLWVRNQNDIDGISYFTASGIESSQEWNSFNIVLPAKDIKYNYCEKLAKTFKISLPIGCDISNIFSDYISDLQIVKEYKYKLKKIYWHGKPHYLYHQILSLCTTFILVFENISSGKYEDVETMYQMLDTLNLLSYIILENRDYFKDKSISNSINKYFGKMSNEQIENEYYDIVNYFIDKIMPIFFSFWSFAFKINASIDIDINSFEYINTKL